MSRHNQKELFNVLGTIQPVKVIGNSGNEYERNTFVPNSQKYLWDRLNSLQKGKKVSCIFSEFIATRSNQQLRYHMVLMGYLADYSGCKKEEMHSIIMVEMFGTKKVTWRGKPHDIRYSVSDAAKFPKYKMVELIDYDLKVCKEMGVKVPTAEELGYAPEPK